MRVKLPAALFAAASLAAIAVSPVAAARPTGDYQQPKINWVQPTIVAHADGTATVHVQYTCYGGNDHTHVLHRPQAGPGRQRDRPHEQPVREDLLQHELELRTSAATR